MTFGCKNNFEYCDKVNATKNHDVHACSNYIHPGLGYNTSATA
jgi:hypothetical protein